MFGDRSHVLRNRTWTPARGIVFASNVGQRRGYASRRITPTASVAPKPTNNQPSAAGVYGTTGLPDIERPADTTGLAAPKGVKQQELEKNLKAREKENQNQADEIRRLEADLQDALVQLIEERKAHKDDKERIYSKGMADGQKRAKEEHEDDKKTYDTRNQEMEENVRKAEARYPELKRSLEEDIVRRERRLVEQNKSLDHAREEHRNRVAGEYREANEYVADMKRKAKEEKDELDERDRELTIKENDISTRRTQRKDYIAYRNIWRGVQVGRRESDGKLREIAIQLRREGHRLVQNLKDQNLDSNPAPADQSQLTTEKLKELETGVDALRKELSDADIELQWVAHDSRNETRGTRFEDTRLAASSMRTGLHITSITPLKSIRARTQQEIDDVETEIQNASNATTREELKYQKEALLAEKVTVNAAIELAFMDSRIQTLETLQHEPYVHKAAHLATSDLQTQVESLYAQRSNNDKKNFIEHWNRIRNSIAAANATAKKTALLLEMKGEHKEHEKRLDAMIVEKIALNKQELQAKRTQLFSHHKSARAAAKRAPVRTVRAWGATASSSTSADHSASALPASPATQDEILQKDNLQEEQELHELLTDSTVSLEPEIRDGKVRRYNELKLQAVEYKRKVQEAMLISSPRKRSEIENNRNVKQTLRFLRLRRKIGQHNLLNGIGPNRPPGRRTTSFGQTQNVVGNPAAVVESSDPSPHTEQDGVTTDLEPCNIHAAEYKLRKLKAEIAVAKAAGELETVELLVDQAVALTARIEHLHAQILIRKKAALGEVTPENAEQHRKYELALAAIGKSHLPETRRERLMNQGNKKTSKLSKFDKQRWAELQLKLFELDNSDCGLSDSEIANMRQSMKLELKQIQLRNFNRTLQDLGPKTAYNATRHEVISKRIRGLEKDLSSSSTGEAASADEAGHKSSESRELDSLMAAWSEEGSPLDGELTASTTEFTVASEASKVGTQDSTGLNMTPTSAQQATHQPTRRRDLHDHTLWTDFLRQQESREGRSLSSFTTTSVSENETACGSGSGSGDVSVVPSADCATADKISNISTEAARDDDDAAAKNDLQAPVSLSTKTSPNDTTDTESTMANSDEDFVPTYEISSDDKKNALIASRNSTASFWRYSLYKNAAGIPPTRHYCTTFEQTEAQVANFLDEKVVGFDLEWEKFKSKPGEDSAKRCVSLVQIAAEGKVALFHLAVFKGGDSTEELIPQSLRAFLEDPKIIKVGVNIGGDATRLRNCFGIEMQGNIELSHLYKLVTHGETDPSKVNRGLYALANQVKEVLHLPLAKGAVRTSSWSKRLNVQQIEYAVSDAYAGLRLYYELERRRKAMVSKPPRPAFHELGMPILLGGGEAPPTKGRRGKQSVDVPEEVIEESAALQEQEQDDDDASEDSEDIYDNPEDLEAFDAYVESQDADTMAGASLPEITYPTLPPLEGLLGENSDIDSSLPSDPIAQTSASRRTLNLHTPEAVAADSWAAAWQSQLPATSTVRVSQPHLRAYHLWHHQGFDLKEIPALLRKEPLALSTVVSYIAEVLQKEDVEFDVEKVRELRARLPTSVRGRYAKLYAIDDKDKA